MADAPRTRPVLLACAGCSVLFGVAGPVLAIVWWVNINTYLDSQHDHFGLLLYATICAVAAIVLAIVSLRGARGRILALIGLIGGVTGLISVVVAFSLLVIGILRWAAQ